MDYILQNALSGLLDGGLKLLPRDRVRNLGYADDIALLNDNAQAFQLALDRLMIEISEYDMCFVP